MYNKPLKALQPNHMDVLCNFSYGIFMRRLLLQLSIVKKRAVSSWWKNPLGVYLGDDRSERSMSRSLFLRCCVSRGDVHNEASGASYGVIQGEKDNHLERLVHCGYRVQTRVHCTTERQSFPVIAPHSSTRCSCGLIFPLFH